MKRNRILYLVMAVLLLFTGCSRDMQSAVTDEDKEELPYTYTYQEGVRYRLVMGRRLQFVFPDQTTILMRAEHNTGNDRIICEFEQPADTEERIDNINLGTASGIRAVYVCCEEGDFILAVVHQADESLQTSFISLGTKEQLEASGSFLYERDGLYTKTEESLGLSTISHVSCGEQMVMETAIESDGNRYMAKRPLVILLKKDGFVQAEDFLNMDAYFIIPAGTAFTVAGRQEIISESIMPISGYYIRAELTDREVTGWFLVKDDCLIFQNADLMTVITTAEEEPSEQICSANVVTESWVDNIMNARVSPEESFELLLINHAEYYEYIDTSEDLLQNSDEAEEKFAEILSGYTKADTYSYSGTAGLDENIYSDYLIVSLPEGIDGVSVDLIYGEERTIVTVTCTYADGRTTTQLYTNFLGRIVALHTAEQGPDGMLVRTEQELQLPIGWYMRGETTPVFEDGEHIGYIYSREYALRNDTELRQGRLVLTQDGHTAEYMLMGADLLVRVK